MVLEIIVYIPLPQGTLIPLPEGTVKIILENPAPPLAGPARAWSRDTDARRRTVGQKSHTHRWLKIKLNRLCMC